MSHIAFIGLGNMGAPMAANLVTAGRAIKGFDLVEAAKTAAAASGVAIAGTAREAVAGADTVITMLPAGKHVLAAMRTCCPPSRKAPSSSIARPSMSRARKRRTRRASRRAC